MATSTVPDLQQELATLEQVGAAASAPFIKSESGQRTAQTVTAEVNLGIAALPLLAQLFTTLGSIIHHTHAMTTAPPNPPVGK